MSAPQIGSELHRMHEAMARRNAEQAASGMRTLSRLITESFGPAFERIGEQFAELSRALHRAEQRERITTSKVPYWAVDQAKQRRK